MSNAGGSQHPEFLGAGAQEGLEIWRIENKVPVKWPAKSYGKFCKGDSYLVLKTTVTSGGSFEWDLHFWLGDESSVDEMGIAAYKTVELDDSLGGAPVQYRETQGSESKKFQALFKQGITYLEGGVESGFRHVERDQYDTRLFHLKGKRNVRVNQVQVSHTSLNSGDVFILDAGLTLYQWNGNESNKYERAKALDVIQHIKDEERGGRAEIVRADEGEEPEAFWSALGGKGRIMSAEEAGGDEEAEKKAKEELRLVEVTMSGKEPSFGEPQRPLKHALLQSSGLFLVDTGYQVFAWVGKGVDKAVKSAAMSAAMTYISNQNRPSSTPIARVVEGAETPVFKDTFADWPRSAAPKIDFSALPSTPSSTKKNVKRQSSSSELASSMHSTPAATPQQKRDMLMAEVNAFTDKVGKVEVWRIENFDMVPLAPDKYGQFFSGDSYVILHSYLDAKGRDAWVIYFWLGRHSSIDEIGTAALKATELDDKYGGAPVQVRVTQNKEPLHMLRLFQGKFVVHEGGNPSSFRNVSEEKHVSDGTGLYHIRGSNEYNTRAVQVDKQATSLNSSDVFVLCNKDQVTVWYGRHGSKDEREDGRAIADVLKGSRVAKEVEEGDEDDGFWAELGGKEPYPPGAPDEDDATAPRLFHCSNATGVFETEEIHDFSQDDLLMDDVYILDVWSEVFCWVGPEANETERRGVMDLCSEYIKGGGRDGTPVLQISAGCEPPNFTCHFLGWDHNKTKVFEDPYEAKMKALKESASSSSSAAAAPETPPAFANLKLKRTPAAAAEGGSTPATPAAAGGADPAGAAGHAGRQSSPFGDVKLRNVSSGSSRTPGQASALPQAVEGPQTSPFGNIKLRSTGVVIDRAPGPLRKSPRESVAPPSPVKTALPTATVAQAMPAASPPAGNYKDPESTRFSYAQLKAHDPAIEADVDPVRRPLYLSEAEMKEVMGVTRQEYLALKPWKQSDLRKKFGLF